MTEAIYPDILGSVNQGFQQGQKMQASKLAGLAYNAAPDQRQAALGKLAGIDVRQAAALQGNFDRQETDHIAKFSGAINYMGQALKTGNQQQIQGAFQAVRPYLIEKAQESGQDPSTLPQQWTDDMLPAFYQAQATIGDLGKSKLPGSLQEFDAMTQNLSPEDQEKARRISLGLDARAVTGSVKSGTVKGPDGLDRPFTFDPATQTYKLFDGQSWRDISQQEVAQIGGQAQQPPQPDQARQPHVIPASNGQPPMQADGMEAAIAQANDMQKQGVPEGQIVQWLQAQAQSMGKDPNGIVPPSGGIATSSIVAPMQPSAGGLAIGRAPEDQAALTAAATTNAQEAAQLSYMPAQEAIKTNALANNQRIQSDEDLRVAREKELLASQSKMRDASNTKTTDANGTLALLSEAEKILPDATGSGVGELRDRVAAGFGTSTTGAQATAQLQTIAGQLTSKMPRMQGPQSDKDVLLYKQMAGDLANPMIPVETRQAALKTIRELNQKYASPQTQSSPSSSGWSAKVIN